ncbi:MAG: phage major capsid protein [Eggerthellaceae bacterium]|nr:phage major capsid protein [Eggerthellaceae bacterium]
MIKFANQEAATQLAQAMAGDDVDAIALAWASFGESIAEQIRADFAAQTAASDSSALEARGYRTLTSAEESWYREVAQALKSRNPEQSFIDLLSDETKDAMPTTIIEDVFRDLEQSHPLLSKIASKYVGYSTKYIINDSTIQMGGWGEIDAKITKEIKGAIKILDLNQSKYTAFCVIPIDLLDMGPTFLDAYIRALFAEALATGLEDAIVNGSGINQPIGMMRNPNGTFDQTSGYPEKEAIKITSFDPASYGAVVSKLVKSESGRERTFSSVMLLTNMTDYLTKVMPATTVLGQDGSYKNNLFPFATDAFPCNSVPDGKAVLGIAETYTLAVGGSRNGQISYDDSIGYLDDVRTFKLVQHGTGRAYDDTCFIVLDISELDPAYITVRNVDAVPTV